MAIVIPSPLLGASHANTGRARIVRISDKEIRAHNGRVGNLCVRIGRQLGMTASEQRVLARSGLLHDIGKIGIPGSILHKHDPLDDSDWKLMRTHPVVGDAIPMEARVVAVADMYDVLTSDRPYRRARSAREARHVLQDEAGPHLDPLVVSALLRSLDEETSRPPAALD